MKTNTLFPGLSLLFVLFSFYELFAQCSYPSATESLMVNRIEAEYRNGGRFLHSDNGVPYTVNEPDLFIFNPGLIKTAGIWMGAQDAAGNLRLAAETYGDGTSGDYYPGPLNEPLDPDFCAKYDRFWRVSRNEINAHLADFNENGQIDNSVPNTILGWPAAGNPYFEQLFEVALPDNAAILAPFNDRNGDGIYDPMVGDYPKVKGDQTVVWFFNDGGPHTASQGNSLNIEVRATAYAFDRDILELDDATFYEFAIRNTEESLLDSAYFGLWVDPDIGCAGDDKIGCDPIKGLAFAHNEDDFDENCNGAHGFGSIPSGLVINTLEGPKDVNGTPLSMSHFMFIGNHFQVPTNVSGLPVSPVEYYNYLSGQWRDGTPLSLGGGGYDLNATPHPWAFDGTDLQPTDSGTTPWTDNALGDKRFLMSYGPFQLAPGAVQKLAFCMVWTQEALTPLPSVHPFREIADITQYYYDTNFSDFITSSSEVIAPTASFLRIFPNPMGATARIQAEDQNVQINEIQLLNTSGQLLRQYSGLNQAAFDLDRANLLPGVYLIRVKVSSGQVISQRLVVS